jgi:hypothetical protein
MTTLVLVLSVLAAPPADTGPAFHDYNRQISDLFKREAGAKDSASRAAAIRQMCELHGELVADSRYEISDTLQQYRARLWSRLIKVKSELKRQLAKDASETQALADVEVLEQADPLSVAVADSLAQTLALADQSQGGPGALLAFGGRAGPPDHGRELVELIERTINPAFWDVVGGPGTIVYYRPLQCLVVRATSEVHGNVGGVLGGLRDAGR